MLNDAREAEDIVHDVFIALWNKAGDFEADRGTAFGWCVTLTRNRAIDRVRARKRRGELLTQSAPGDLGYDENQADNADSGDMLFQKEKAAAIRQAMRGDGRPGVRRIDRLADDHGPADMRWPKGSSRHRRGRYQDRDCVAIDEPAHARFMPREL